MHAIAVMSKMHCDVQDALFTHLALQSKRCIPERGFWRHSAGRAELTCILDGMRQVPAGVALIVVLSRKVIRSARLVVQRLSEHQHT